MNKPQNARRAIPRVKRSDLIVEEIKRWIVARGMKPGDRLPQERELIDTFESGRSTVREALKVLESEGLVERLPGVNGGARVASVPYEQTSRYLRNYLYFQPLSWAQVYRVRERLEPILAAEVVSHLSEDDLSALEATIEVCRRGIAGEVGPREHRKAELDFHSILAEACPDPMLRFVCSFITDLLRDLTEYRNVIEPLDSAFARAALRYHVQLLDAFKAGDRAQVEAIMAEHIHDAGCFVQEQETEFDSALLFRRGSHG